jgi:hypothetical protein
LVVLGCRPDPDSRTNKPNIGRPYAYAVLMSTDSTFAPDPNTLDTLYFDDQDRLIRYCLYDIQNNRASSWRTYDFEYDVYNNVYIKKRCSYEYPSPPGGTCMTTVTQSPYQYEGGRLVGYRKRSGAYVPLNRENGFDHTTSVQMSDSLGGVRYERKAFYWLTKSETQASYVELRSIRRSKDPSLGFMDSIIVDFKFDTRFSGFKLIVGPLYYSLDEAMIPPVYLLPPVYLFLTSQEIHYFRDNVLQKKETYIFTKRYTDSRFGLDKVQFGSATSLYFKELP